MLIYLLLLAAACLALLIRAMLRPRLFYEYPYLMAATFTAFILPQAYAAYRSEWGGWYLDAALIMSTACLGACWFGYLPKAHPALLEKFNVKIDPARFFHGGVLLVAIGYYFTYKFGTLEEEELTTTLTGIGTIYLFFGALVYPGFAICFYCALNGQGPFTWIVTGIAAWVPLQAAIFYGRREPTVLFLLSLAMILYFLKGKRLPRVLILGAVVGAMFAIPATGEYRRSSAEDPIEAFRQLDFADQFNQYFNEDAPSEFKNAVTVIAVTTAQGDYEWGVGYWNRLIFRFVPAQFVGETFKNSLMIGKPRDYGDYVELATGFRLPAGSTVTGIGDSFNQFGLFGCLVFAGMAYIFKNLWVAANQPGGTVAQILYIQVSTTGMRALTHQTIDFLPGFIYSAIFIGLVALYAKE
ncbi:MAG: hypothetical protein DME97_07055 [Verrucomicrobia bacterium]|nr:MAG: hypothetical protein DME97_07055 [Verrucomicrobiota bacterium]